MTKKEFDQFWAGLSKKEKRVLELLDGRTSDEIGKILEVKGRTIKWYLTAIYEQLPIPYTQNKRTTLLGFMHKYL